MVRRGVLVIVSALLSVVPAFSQSMVAFSPIGMRQLVGAAASPPAGPGPGVLVDWPVGAPKARDGHFGRPNTPSGNSFFLAFDGAQGTLYVPTVAGKTYVLSARDLEPIGQFSSLPGGRVARIVPGRRMVLILSAKELAAYSTGAREKLFELGVGGNALVVSPDGRRAFIGGNMDSTITEVSLPSGKVVRTFPIARSGDLAWADGKIFSADIKSGVMSVLDPRTGRITRIATPEVDPDFSYPHLAQARAGFMQVAVSPDQRTVYVAGFSGHILSFSTDKPAYLGEVAVSADPAGPNKLSGLAVLDNGREALATVENLHEAVVVKLSDGKILHVLKGAASNRWVTVP